MELLLSTSPSVVTITLGFSDLSCAFKPVIPDKRTTHKSRKEIFLKFINFYF